MSVIDTSLLTILDALGIAVFALTGALMAVQRRHTLVTAAFFALVTGVGGGSVRDLLIGAPVFWVTDGLVAGICLGVALFVWVTPERWWRGDVLVWADAVGLAGYAVFGAAKALTWGVPVVPAMLMGVITACVGGVIRDLLAGVPSIILRRELYVTAAALAVVSYCGLLALGAPSMVAGPLAAALGFALRGAAIRYNLAIPAYRGAQP